MKSRSHLECDNPKAQVKVNSLIGEEEGLRGSRQTLYEVQIHAYAFAQYFAISDQRGVASDTIFLDPNLYVIVLSFAKLQ